jgi:hypothetical protein
MTLTIALAQWEKEGKRKWEGEGKIIVEYRMAKALTIALIAHDGKKKEMVDLVSSQKYVNFFKNNLISLLGTKATGIFILFLLFYFYFFLLFSFFERGGMRGGEADGEDKWGGHRGGQIRRVQGRTDGEDRWGDRWGIDGEDRWGG